MGGGRRYLFVHRLVALVVAALIGLTGCWVAPAAAAQEDPASIEAAFVARINALRAEKGLGTLEVHPELTALARRWAGSMAAADRISHNPALSSAVKADWQKLGENVGVGTTVDKLHAAFVASPTHYRNLVDRDFTYVGVGVVFGRDGAIFTAHQFMRLRSGSRPAAAPAAAAPSSRPSADTSASAPPAATVPQPSLRLVLVLQQLRALDLR